MEKLINRVGLSWLYDHIKYDLNAIVVLLSSNLNNETDHNLVFKSVDNKFAHLAKVFYLLNVPTGVFFINEFRLSLKFTQAHYETQPEHNEIRLNIVINSIANIFNYIEDIIQGYGDLLIYYVAVIDQLRQMRSEVLFSECSYIVNSVHQHNISALPIHLDKQVIAQIEKALHAIRENQTWGTAQPENKEKLLHNVNLIKQEFRATPHYLLWELVYAYVLLEKNYEVKTSQVIDNLLDQVFTSYTNALNATNGFEKLTKTAANWIGTLCFNLIYCNGFQILPQDVREKIQKILIIHDRKSLSNYMAFAERMQDTDGWIMILDIASELDIAINKLKDCKRKKIIELSWLQKLLQKHIDSCILTGTYGPLENYYQTAHKLKHHFVSGEFVNGQNLEAVENLILELIQDVELAVANSTHDEIDEDFIAQESLSQVNLEAQKSLLKHQLTELDKITQSIATENNITNKYIKEQLRKIVNIFTMISFQPGVNISNHYLTKIQDETDHDIVSESLQNNVLVFIKYLSEIIKALYNNRSFTFYIKAAKKLADNVELATISKIAHDKEEQDKTTESKAEIVAINDSSKMSLTQIFLDEAEVIIENIDAILKNWQQNVAQPELIESLQRELHTLKGASRMVGFSVVGQWLHHLEDVVKDCVNNLQSLTTEHIDVIKLAGNTVKDLIESYQAGVIPEMPQKIVLNFAAVSPSNNDLPISVGALLNKADSLAAQNKPSIPLRQTVRIENTELDDLLDVVSELIMIQHKLTSQLNFYNAVPAKLKSANSSEKVTEVSKEIAEHNIYHNQDTKNNEKNIASLFDKLINLRMIPINAIRTRLENLVNHIAKELNKKIQLSFNKTDGLIDRVILEQITPSLEHLIRNAIDHGIESEMIRRKFNKSPIGQISISFYTDDTSLIIEIADDGAGIDTAKLRDNTPNSQPLTNDEILTLISRPSFTTVKNVSEVSGRGIGLDVVYNMVKKLHGSIKLDTRRHHNTVFTMKIPFSLTKQSLLFIKISDITYAIPLLIIDEVTTIKSSDLAHTNKSVKYNNIEVFSMFDLLNIDKKKYSNYETVPKEQNSLCNLVIINHDAEKIAFMVDEIYETKDSVIRPLPPKLQEKNTIAYMGCTVYQDSQVVLILDLSNMLANYDEKKLAIAKALTQTNNINNPIHTQEQEVNDKSDQQAVNVLVVEDSATVRHAIEHYLNGLNYNLITAVDGLDGLNKIKNVIPSLILLDIAMPNMNGLEFLKRVRAESHLKDIPVIIMTSRDEETYRERAMELNVDVYLKKPYDKAKLINAIEYVLD